MLARLIPTIVCFLAVAAVVSQGAPINTVQATVETQLNLSQSKGYSNSPVARYDGQGRLHVAWADNPGSDDVSTLHVLYARSTDDGATFSTPVQISGPVAAGIRAREVRVTVTDSNVVAVAWWAVMPDEVGEGYATVFVAVSRDGGSTFAPAVETSLRFRDRIRADREGFSNTTNLSVAVTSAGRIYLTFTAQDYFHGYNVYFARSSDGVSFSEPKRLSNYSLTIPRATCNVLAVADDATVYAAWTESNGDFIDEIKDVYYVRSSDGGASFTAPRAVVRATGVVASATADSTGLHLLTQIQKTPRSIQNIKLFSSKDGGAVFGRGARIGKADHYTHLHQNSISRNDAGVVAICWTENAATPRVADGIYVAVSTDGGKTFPQGGPFLPGLYFEQGSAAVSPAGTVVAVYATGSVNLVDREIMVQRIMP